jgi:hypothetical protein
VVSPSEKRDDSQFLLAPRNAVAPLAALVVWYWKQPGDLAAHC